MTSKFLAVLFLVSSIAACNGNHRETYKKVPPAKVEARDGEKIPYVVLTPDAEKRLGIETLPQAVPAPTAAMIVDTSGKTWIYVQTAPQTYHRVPSEEKQSAPIVTVGAAELYGTESGVGK